MSEQMEAHALAYRTCAYCPKVCRFACPVAEATHQESTSTWAKMSAADFVQRKERPLDEAAAKALHACSGCGRCTTFCKHDNQVGPALFAARAEALEKGLQPKGASSTLATFSQWQNPFGHDLAPLVEAHRAAAPMRHPLFTGCTALARRSALIDDALEVANAFGAPMGVARVSARCCGYPLYAAGAHEQFAMHARSFADALEPYPELVVLDPGCAFTLKVVYPRFEVKLPSRIRTVYEVLAENLAHAPRLKPLEEKAGYHDACHLGRGLGQYEEPRALLKAAVAEVSEAFSNRAEGGCAGGGGLLPRTMPEASVEVARRQALEVAPDGANVVTACPTSRRQFERAGKASEDLLSVLKRWLAQGQGEKA